MTPLSCHVLVLAKQPLAGRVKTRLTPALTPQQAADVAAAALADTLAAVAAAPVAARTLVLDGQLDFSLPAGTAVLPQRGTGLAERLTAAFDDAFTGEDGTGLPLLLVGMDTPQLTTELLTTAATTLLGSAARPPADAVLGHAADGGWWALGLHRPHPRAFSGVPMSTGRTGAAQAERLVELGLAPVLLPVLRDIDTTDDLDAVARDLPPDTALARWWSQHRAPLLTAAGAARAVGAVGA